MADIHELIYKLRNEKKQIDRYNKGTFGVCIMCKKPVEPGRLEAFPQASLCLSCKSKQMKDARNR